VVGVDNIYQQKAYLLDSQDDGQKVIQQKANNKRSYQENSKNISCTLENIKIVINNMTSTNFMMKKQENIAPP
jgi:hypothetical protein